MNCDKFDGFVKGAISELLRHWISCIQRYGLCIVIRISVGLNIADKFGDLYQPYREYKDLLRECITTYCTP